MIFLNICKIAIASTGLDRGLSCAPGQQLHGLCTGIYGQTQDEFHSWEIQRSRQRYNVEGLTGFSHQCRQTLSPLDEWEAQMSGSKLKSELTD